MRLKPTQFLRSGGIFLQLFAGLWAALFILGFLVWVASENYQQVPRNFGDIESGRAAQRAVNNAIGIYHWGGREVLVSWLTDKTSNNRPEVFVTDADGNEISGRKVPEKAAESLRHPTAEQYILQPCRMVPGMGPGMGMGRGMMMGRHHMRGNNIDCLNLNFFAVRTDLPPRNLFLAFWHTPLWVHILFALLATSIAAGLLAWRFARPIKKLDWAMRRASEGDLTVRVAPEVGHSYDEIGALAQRFDATTEKINGLIARQKRLFHDVSHELRSPLARIEIAVAIAEKNPERRGELLTRIEKDVQALDALVDELLTYARLDDNAPMDFVETDVVPLLEDIVENARFEGTPRHVAMTLDAPAAQTLKLHVDSFGRAAENIIRNALRYSPEGGTVTVTAKKEADNFVIRVSDEGPGMDPEDLAKIFQPFVRGKNEATGSGFGLGLAIAKRAAERHGGSLTAVNRKPHGLIMTLTVPAA